jgi:ribosomal-protein-serine acetyltransferase
MFRKPLVPPSGDGYSLGMLEEHRAYDLFSVVDRNREHLRAWLPWVDATQTPDDSAAYIRSALERIAHNQGRTAVMLHGRDIAGVIGTHAFDWLNRRAELGYWIAREHQGKGVVTEACRVVIHYLFEELALHRVEIHCATGNDRSISVAKRLGFTEEGRLRESLRLNARYHDRVVFAMLRQDWPAAQPRP